MFIRRTGEAADGTADPRGVQADLRSFDLSAWE